jgi:hypothetical protein
MIEIRAAHLHFSHTLLVREPVQGRLVSFRAGTFLGIELDVHEHYALWVRRDRFVIANYEVIDVPVID